MLGLISPSVPGLVHSCVKPMAVEGSKVCKQVGDEGTSLRRCHTWQNKVSHVVSSVETSVDWVAEKPSPSPLRSGEWALKEGAGPFMDGLVGCLWLAVGHICLSVVRSWGICKSR